jgi:hypothetical protein
MEGQFSPKVVVVETVPMAIACQAILAFSCMTGEMEEAVVPLAISIFVLVVPVI